MHEHRHHRLTLAATFLHVGIAVSTIAIIAKGQRWPWYARAAPRPRGHRRGRNSLHACIERRGSFLRDDRKVKAPGASRRHVPRCRTRPHSKSRDRGRRSPRRPIGPDERFREAARVAITTPIGGTVRDAERGGRRPETMNELHIGEKRHEGEEPALEYRFADCHGQVVPRDVRGREGEPERHGPEIPSRPSRRRSIRGSRFHLRAKTLKHPHKRPITPNRASPPSACASNLRTRRTREDEEARRG